MIRNNGWLNPIAVLSINLFLSLKYLIVYIFDASTIIFFKTVHSHFTFAHPLFDQLWSFSNWPGVSNRWIPRFLEEKQTTEISGLWRRALAHHGEARLRNGCGITICFKEKTCHVIMYSDLKLLWVMIICYAVFMVYLVLSLGNGLHHW
jgi:hypothetical protein